MPPDDAPNLGDAPTHRDQRLEQVVVAARGKIRLAAEIALASSAQVAVFLIPAVALLIPAALVPVS